MENDDDEGFGKRAFSNGIFVVEPAREDGREPNRSTVHISTRQQATHTKEALIFLCLVHIYAAASYTSLSHSLSQFVVIVPYFETGNCCSEPTDTT